jgi:ABC-type phosphate transport system permease subunit
MKDQQSQALVLWLAEQQQASRLAQQQTRSELHLHQHHHAAPAPPPLAEPEQPQTVRLHPIFVATYMLFVSVAISLPIALIAAIVESNSRPDVQYVQPQRGGW